MAVNDIAWLRRVRTLLAAAVVLLVAAGCGSSGAAASAVPSGPVSIDTESEAAAAVGRENQLLARIGPLESDAVGQANHWDADATSDGYRVRYVIGWGDCLAGCIGTHEFEYEVSRAGRVTLIAERGDAIPADVLEQLAQAGGEDPGQGIRGRLVAGPVCPVEQPDDPACDPRPVPGATVVLRSVDGSELRIEADESGLFSVELPPGEYVIEPQPVEGYLAAPEPAVIEVQQGSTTEIELEYDTGIR